MKTRPYINKTGQQASRVRPAKAKRGLKVCPKPLARIIELANLLGDQQLPDLRFIDFRRVEGIPFAEYLPDPLRIDLLEVMSNPKTWEMSPEEYIAKWTIKVDMDEARGYLQAAALADRYALISGAREALKAIVQGLEVFPVTTFLKRGPDGKATYAGDPISDALLEAELDYLKQCPICGKFFYAQRSTQDACPLSCSPALRKRRKRASDKVKRERSRKSVKRGK